LLFYFNDACQPLALRCLSTSHTSNLIINAVGEDRLGIVSEITKHVTSVGGNVGESRAAKLGSHFSLMMLIQIPSEKITTLKADLATMKDMNVSTFETSAPKSEVTPRIGCTCSL
jgi:glycine cleavage system transcriptional repressor